MLTLFYPPLLKFIFHDDYFPNLSIVTLLSVLYTEFKSRSILPLSIFFSEAHNLPEQFWIISIILILTISYYTVNSIKEWLHLQNKIRIGTIVSGHLAQLQEELDSVQRLKVSMQRRSAIHLATIASISHDIKSPIGFITRSARQINDSIDRNEMDQIAKACEVISYTSDKIFHLVDGMSEFLRNGIHEEEIDKEEISLVTLVSDKISTFSEIIAAHNGKISIKIRPEEIVFTNAKLLGSVIHNLIDNAIKAKFSNHITISTKVLGDKMHLIISDTGPGMPEQVVALLNSDRLVLDDDKHLFRLHQGLGIILITEICHLLDLSLVAFNEAGAHIHIIFSDSIYYNGKD